jgi:hypothetical protein
MAEPLKIPADRWHSGQPTTLCPTPKLTQGQIVIVGRKPFRIERVRALETHEWPEKFVEAWRKQDMPDCATWHQRPYRVEGFWETPGASQNIHGTVAPDSHIWNVLPEHYSVCRLCGELPPCTHVLNERIMERAAERMTRDMAILPGMCHACREPITKRQKSFTFPGANLIRPDLGDHSAIFHTRQGCLGTVRSYDERWAKAESDRSRLFFCEGTITRHADGTRECSRDDCLAKGELRDLVDHRCAVWHHRERRDIGSGHNCWCLDGTRAEKGKA